MKEVLVVLVIIVALVMGVHLLIDGHARYSCDQFEIVTGKETRYVYVDTCYINHEGEWLRYETYNRVLIGRDGLMETIEELDQ